MDETHGEALERRGLDPELAARHGWKPAAGPTDALWIAIPYVDGGKRVGTKYRTIEGEKAFTQQPGTPQIFWNGDALTDPELAGYPLVITEGEIDALAAIQAGYRRTVSVPGGAPQQDDDGADSKRWGFLGHAKAALAKATPIVLAVDNDRPGNLLQEGLARRLGRSRCQVLQYPTGKDLGDVLASGGAEAVRLTLAQATYLPMPGLMRLREIEEPPLRRALDTLIPGMIDHLRIRGGDFIVVTGPPGHGKSSFINNLCCNMAWHWNVTSVVASMEALVVPDLRRVLRSYRAECLERDMSPAQKGTADAWIDSRFIFVQGGDEDMTLDWILERFAAAIHRHGATICVIDPWNEVSIADKPADWTTEQFVSQSLRLIKQFARTHNVCMVVVAHPRKLSRDRNGKVPKPGLWDIADSAAWANRADLGVVVFRSDMEPATPTEISIEKSRDHYAIGIPGMVSLRWSQETSRFIKPS